MSDRSHPKVRTSALLLSALVLSPDSALASYRKRRASDPKLDLEHLERARAILDAIGQALQSKDKGRWRRIDDAYRLLARDAELDLSEPEPAPAEAPSAGGEEKSSVPNPTPSEPAVARASSSSIPPPRESSPSAPVLGSTAPLGTAALGSPPAPPVAPLPPAPPPPPSIGVPKPSLGAKPPPLKTPPALASPASLKPSAPQKGPGGGDPGQTQQDPMAATITQVPGATADAHVMPFKGKRSPAPKSMPAGRLPQATPFEDPLTTDQNELTAPVPVAAASTPPELTVEQYATLRAVALVQPARLAVERPRYGVRDAEMHEALDEVWRRRTEADAALGQRLEELTQHYAEWIRSQG